MNILKCVGRGTKRRWSTIGTDVDYNSGVKRILRMAEEIQASSRYQINKDRQREDYILLEDRLDGEYIILTVKDSEFTTRQGKLF